MDKFWVLLRMTMDGEREILEIGSSFEVACKAAKDRHQSGATAIVVMEAMAPD